MKFLYETDVSVVDLEVCISLVESIPTASNCLIRRENPRMLILYEKEGKEDEFYEENMYVSLVSKKELKVNMRIGFPF